MLGYSPIYLAAGLNPNPDIFRALLALWPEGMTAYIHRPLHGAAAWCNIPLLRIVFDADPEAFDVENNDGRTPYDISGVGLPGPDPTCVARREATDQFLETIHQKIARERWTVIRSCMKLLSLHKRGVIRANHPEAKRLRGEFEIDD